MMFGVYSNHDLLAICYSYFDVHELVGVVQSIPFPFGWLLNKKAARVEVNILLAFLHWVGIALHP